MVGMQALSGEPGDVRAIHAVLHAMESKVGAVFQSNEGPSARRTSISPRNRGSVVRRPRGYEERIDPRPPPSLSQSDAEHAAKAVRERDGHRGQRAGARGAVRGEGRAAGERGNEAGSSPQRSHQRVHSDLLPHGAAGRRHGRSMEPRLAAAGRDGEEDLGADGRGVSVDSVLDHRGGPEAARAAGERGGQGARRVVEGVCAA